MKKTLSISLATFIVASAVIVAYGTIRAAYAASSLFGGASQSFGYVTLVSDLSDVDATNDYSGVSFDDVNGVPLSSLAELSADYNVTDDDCGAGSPRFQVRVDMDNDGLDTGADRNVFIYMGPYPSYAGCQQNTWISSGNLIATTTTIFDTAQVGGTFYDSWANTLTLVGAKNILDVNIVIDSGWSAQATGGDSEQTVLIDNVKIAKLVSSTYDFEPPPTATVTIVKYVDGVHANAGNTGGLSYPMDASWNATNIGAGSGSFVLSTTGFNNPNPYEATTADMTSGADYSVAENLLGANVGASCSEGKPFALAGYSIGDTEALAVAAATTSSAVLTGITSDKFIIVWNQECPPPPPPPPPSNACATPGTPPTGFTLLVGTTSHDNVVIAPMTMFVGNGGNDVVKGAADGDYIVCLADGFDKVILGNGDFTIAAGENYKNITTGSGTGTIIVGNGPNRITTADGEQSITTGNGNNNILTGNGDKTITTGSGNDRITTGGGNDTINAGDGYNRVKTGGGTDGITTGVNNDNINGEGGFDTCNGGGGFDTITNCEA